MHHNSCSMVIPKQENPDIFSGMVVKTEYPIGIFDEKKVKIEGEFQHFSADFEAGVPQKTSSGLAFRVKNEQDSALKKGYDLDSMIFQKTEIPESFLNMVIKSEFPEEEKNVRAPVKTSIMEKVENFQGSSEVVKDKDVEKAIETSPSPTASSLILNLLHSEQIYLEDETEKHLLAAIGIRDRQTIKKTSPLQKTRKQKYLQKRASEVQPAPSVSPSEVRVSPGAPAKNIPDLTKYMRVVPAFRAKRGLGEPRYIVRPGVKIEDNEPLEKKLRVEPGAEVQEVQIPVLGPKSAPVGGPRTQLRKAVAIPRRQRPLFKERSIFPAKLDPEQQRLLKLKPVEKLVLRPPAGGYVTQKCVSRFRV